MGSQSGPSADASKWNHNIHYHPLLLAQVAVDAQRVLDVGCGEGVLTRALAGRTRHAVGLDLHGPGLRLARQQSAAPNVHYVQGDLLAAPFQPASFDSVVSVATLHHLPAREGLLAMAGLVRPGGHLAVLGLARSRLPHDLGREVAAALATRALTVRRRYWQHSSPVVWPPAQSYDEVRRTAAEALPGSTYRRLLLWRYLVTWRRPA